MIPAELSIREPLFRWIQQQTGLYITDVNQGPVLLALKVLATENRENQDNYAALLINGLIDPQPFFDAVTTHESFFLRHRRHMEVAIERVIKPLLNQGKRPRILSAPCAQGEEPYSFAMLLQDNGVNPDRVEIVGVDIAASSIELAKKGCYRRYSLRQVPESFISHHFRVIAGEMFQVSPFIMQKVKFQRMNLLTESLARMVPGFDLIFCHNMLIYFDRDTTVRMLGVFEQLLAKEGWLFVDSTEVPHVGGVFEGETLNGVRAFHKHGMKKAELNKHLQTTFTPNYDPRPQAQAQTQPQGLPTVSVPAVVEPFAPHVVAAKSSPQPVEDISEKRRLAEQAYKNKQFEESLRLYDQLIDQHPLWASWARLGKARVLLDSGEELEALETAETALSAKKMTAGIYLTQADEADAHAIIVLVLHNKGLKSKLAEHLKRGRHLNPKHEGLRIVQ